MELPAHDDGTQERRAAPGDHLVRPRRRRRGADGEQWRRNIAACPDVVLEIAGHRLVGRARPIDDETEAEAIRQCFVRRYLGARLARPFGGYTRSTAVRVGVDRVER